MTAPPYDVISPEDEARYRRASPFNIVRLVLTRDEPGDDGAEVKYARAGSLLSSWREGLVLVPDQVPAYYPYEMRFVLGGRPRRLRGLICQVELEPWGGSIVPHEETMAGPVEDRLHLMRSTKANLSAIHAVFRGPCPGFGKLLHRVAGEAPIAEVHDEEGVEHRLWRLPETAKGAGEVAGWLEDEQLLIADGHHRYTMALRYRNEIRSRYGAGPWDQVMMLVVPADQAPPVLPIHRIVLRGLVPIAGARVRDLQEVLAQVSDDEVVYGTVALQEGELVHRVRALDGSPPTVCALHEQVLGGLDASRDLTFTADAVAAETAVREGRAAGALFLPPTTTARIREVIERGGRLPQKSTYFWPKPRTGLVLRPLS